MNSKNTRTQPLESNNQTSPTPNQPQQLTVAPEIKAQSSETRAAAKTIISQNSQPDQTSETEQSKENAERLIKFLPQNVKKYIMGILKKHGYPTMRRLVGGAMSDTFYVPKLGIIFKTVPENTNPPGTPSYAKANAIQLIHQSRLYRETVILAEFAKAEKPIVGVPVCRGRILSLDPISNQPVANPDKNKVVSLAVMNYVYGQNLEDALKLSETPEQMAEAQRKLAIIMCSVLATLEQTHELGTLHRDIKPPNIIVESDKINTSTDYSAEQLIESARENVTLIDWGIAYNMHHARRLTPAGGTIGSFATTSPERLLKFVEDRDATQTSAKKPHIIEDPRSEIFSVASTLFCILNREKYLYEVIEEKSSSSSSHPKDNVVSSLLFEKRTPVKNLTIEGVDEKLMKIVRKGLMPIAQRYQSVNEMKQDLMDYLDGKKLSSEPTTPIAKISSWASRWFA